MGATIRRSTTALAAVLALALSGCGGEAGDPSLTIYLSAPKSGPAGADGRDIAAAARLALDDAGGAAGGVPVRLEVLDAGSRGGGGAQAGVNARTATQDSTAIAYIGELDSGTTRTSEPITNEAGLLQVSPGASAVDLTRAAPGSDQVPETQPTGVRTFARVIPSDVAQGAAAAGAAEDAGVRAVRVYGGRDRYEDALRFGWESVSDAPPLGAGGDAIYNATARPGFAAGAPARSRAPSFGADAQIFGSPPRSAMGPGSLLVSGALAPSQLPDPDFAELFRDAYDRSPGRFAAYGYEAMASVLDAVDRAGDPLDRKSVVDSYFATAGRDSVLGTYSIDDRGDTTLDRVGAYVVRPGGGAAPAGGPLPVP